MHVKLMKLEFSADPNYQWYWERYYPQIYLEYDCCIFERKVAKFNGIHLELSLKTIVNRLEDLGIASHKFEKVEKLISEQEWRIKQSKFYSHLPFLSYVGMVKPALFWLTVTVALSVVRGDSRTFPFSGRKLILASL